MARNGSSINLTRKRFPHPRGDGPLSGDAITDSERISPPAWGWPGVALVGDDILHDFPTRVGMARGGDAV